MVRRAQTAIYLEGETERQSGKKRERAREKEREREAETLKSKKLAERDLERDSVANRERRGGEKLK